MDKAKLHTEGLAKANIDKVAELFPNCFTESLTENGSIKRVIDFDLLRQELSNDVVEGPKERYRLDWPGKRESLALANAPISKTLRPCKEESVCFDTTQNLYIEGDNLDALKLLQETYLNQVKMIYIDPPYNTGNDFIYDDNYSMSKHEYTTLSGNIDEEGRSMFNEEKWKQNSSVNGRFHSEWLSMIYPRLKLARNLLREDGLIFISIDDGEVSGLRKICDEIFGEVNFVANILWQKTYSPANDKKGIDAMHDHVIVYQKSSSDGIYLLPRTDKQDKAYTNPDNDPRGPWKAVDASRAEHRDYAYYPITTPGGKIVYPADGRSWVFTKEELPSMLKDNLLWFGQAGTSKPSRKLFLKDVKQGLTPTTWWNHEVAGHNDLSKKELKRLFPDRLPFQTPKPTKLISRMLQVAVQTDRQDIVLDFFSGSATTAHSVIQSNAKVGGNCRYIMIQLPEPCAERSEAYKAGFVTIAEIGKERIRRAGKQIQEDLKAKLSDELPGSDDYNSIKERLENLDAGFRVMKLDSSNMADVYYQPDELSQDGLGLHVDNVKEGRTPEDLLFQVLLDWGVDLGLPITEEIIEGKKVFFVNDRPDITEAQAEIAACFDTELSEKFCKALATRKPMRAVFRDGGYASDSTKINIEQIFKALSPHTELKTL